MSEIHRDTPALFSRLSRSRFRSRFKLTAQDIEYINRIGMEKIESHAKDFITSRLAPESPKNDGRQTPFKGHPVFKAQHATASCCRSCLEKWHGISMGRSLTAEETGFVVRVIMEWIIRKSSRKQQVESSQ